MVLINTAELRAVMTTEAVGRDAVPPTTIKEAVRENKAKKVERKATLAMTRTLWSQRKAAQGSWNSFVLRELPHFDGSMKSMPNVHSPFS